MIHSTAIVHPKAKLGSGVRVGPGAVIDEGVELGAECEVGPHVYITGVTTVGSHNKFHAGCVIGDAPQDLKYKDAPTRLIIGDHNVFREHATAHRSTKPEEATVPPRIFIQRSIASGFWVSCCVGAHQTLFSKFTPFPI